MGKGCRQHLTLCWPVTGVSLFLSLDRLGLPMPSCANVYAPLSLSLSVSSSALNSICIMLWHKVDNHLPVRHFNSSRLESLKTDSGKVYSINPLAKVIDKAFNCFRKWQLSVSQAVCQSGSRVSSGTRFSRNTRFSGCACCTCCLPHFN